MTTREGIRTRSHNLILFAKLKDSDPKVVCQAIRGLLVFKGERPEASVKNRIGGFQQHRKATEKLLAWNICGCGYKTVEKTRSHYNI